MLQVSYALGPIATQDQYVDVTTRMLGQECARLTVFVSNAPVKYSLTLEGDANWGEEHELPSATGQTFAFSFDRRFTGVRFKSATSGTPATVIAQMIPPSELPPGA